MPAFPARVRALVFDVDGTLYHQALLRLCMAAELSVECVRSPHRGATIGRVLSVFRKVRESLRDTAPPARPLDEICIERTSAATGVAAGVVARAVDEWIHERPLKYLRACRRAGLVPLLQSASERQIALGVLSDYPAAAKLDALGLTGVFTAALCTTDPDINAFKPHPRGFQRICERLGIPPEETVYVGDRPETDAAGAHAAGIACVLVGRGRSARAGGIGARRFAGVRRSLARC